MQRSVSPGSTPRRRVRTSSRSQAPLVARRQGQGPGGRVAQPARARRTVRRSPLRRAGTRARRSPGPRRVSGGEPAGRQEPRPGRVALPWHARAAPGGRGAPRHRVRFRRRPGRGPRAVWSSRPTLDPARTSTRSATAAARLTAAAIAVGSSGCTSLTAVQAPAWAARAASMTELLSTMSPRPSGVPTGRTSSPVGTIATTGCLVTSRVVWPAAAAAARSAGRSRRPAGTSRAPTAKSSPRVRTFSPRRAGAVTTALPSDRISGLLPGHHGVRPGGYRVSGIDPGKCGGRDHLPGRGRTGHRYAVHRGAVAARRRPPGLHRFRQDPVEPVGYVHLLGHRRAAPPRGRACFGPPGVGILRAQAAASRGDAHVGIR